MFARNQQSWSRHLARSTPWHRSDPRVRLAATLLLSALALASRNAAGLAVTYGLLAVLYALSRTGPRTAWAGFRPFFFLLLFTAVVQIFFTPGDPLVESGRFSPSVTFEGLVMAALILLRLAAVILLSTHLIATTSPLELSRSLGWAFAPSARLGVPVADLVLILNLGFQFFPIILEESQSLRLALESRGISLRHPRMALRFKALTAWILAILSSVLERSQRLAVALEIKNFGHGRRLRLRFPPWSRESSFFSAFSALSALLWFVTSHY